VSSGDQLDEAVNATLAEVQRLSDLLSDLPAGERMERNQPAGRTRAGGGIAGSVRADFRVPALQPQSEGAFDITVGPLMKAWGFFKGSDDRRAGKK